jgi:DNA-binding transcriptional ArsR family regulator
MPDTPEIASVAALVADPTRARMLMALMSGRALTATELALEGGVTPPTASSHLARLSAGGILAPARQGRHRYFRIATPQVAEALEQLMSLRAGSPAPAARTGPRDEALRRARVCYDHLAGEAAVRLLTRLRERGLLGGRDEDDVALTPAGEAWCRAFGVDLDAMRARRRPLCRPCLDWSERRTHLAGAVGAGVLERMFALGYARRVAGSRAVALSPRGESFLEHPHLLS